MTTRNHTMDQVRAFLEGTEQVACEIPGRAERLGFIVQSLGQLGFERLGKKEQGRMIRYLCRITGLSRQKMSSPITRWPRRSILGFRRHAGAWLGRGLGFGQADPDHRR